MLGDLFRAGKQAFDSAYNDGIEAAAQEIEREAQDSEWAGRARRLFRLAETVRDLKR